MLVLVGGLVAGAVVVGGLVSVVVGDVDGDVELPPWVSSTNP